MSGIPPQTLNRLRHTLSMCRSFQSDRELQVVFIDSRISIWRDHIPYADSMDMRILQTIDFLLRQYNDRGENALVLFLQVLSDRQHYGDALHRELIELAHELERIDRFPENKTQQVGSNTIFNSSLLRFVKWPIIIITSILLIGLLSIWANVGNVRFHLQEWGILPTSTVTATPTPTIAFTPKTTPTPTITITPTITPTLTPTPDLSIPVTPSIPEPTKTPVPLPTEI